MTDLNKGLRDARDNGRPVLVYAGADWCEPCRELHKQLVRPEVRAKLAGWTLVYLDVDKEPQPPAALGIGPIPALRLLTPAGRVVGSQDGFIPGEELVHWLDENRTRATSKVDADLAAARAPDEASVVRLVAVLGDADPALREAAIRRLAPHPAAAAGAAVQRFLKGDLASRLAALELLQEWQAPTDGLDPWRRETLTPQRLGALERWAASKAAAGPGAAATRPAATKPTALSVERMNEARGELDRLLLAGDDEEARAGIERLARIGPALLPEVYDRLKGATNDARRERLTTLRYRLVASGALAVTWPAGLRRLASPDPATRHAAAEELVKRATPQDAPLLVELFSDPDPLVREISLWGMRAVGSGLESGAGPDDTTASTAPVTTPGALAKLLNDPIPNVRAAVLKELSSSEPDADAVALVVKYVKDEKDVDLLVHAVRVLREARRAGAAARQCLIDLLGHESWRVRAEAAEALGKQLENQQFSRSKSNGPVEQALLKLLQDEDGFVASRAVLALQRSSLEETADAMAKAAEKHPELTGDIVAAFRGGGRGTESKKITQHLRRFCAHADPAVRAAAVEGLATLAGGGGAAKELGAALKDPAARVRIAGARAVVAALDGLRPDSAEDREEVGSAAVTVFGIRWGSSPATRKRLAAAWLEKFRAGEGRPEWFNQLIEPLRACMAGTDPAERVWAAAALVAVGQDDAALPVMREAARQHPEVRVAAASSLPWLPPDKRLALFDELLATGVGQGELGQLISYLAKLPEPRVTDRLWQLVAAPGADVETADDVLDGLRTAYFAGQHYNASQLPAAKLAKIAEAAKEKALKGPELQRVVALVLLANSSDEEAAAAAAAVRADPSASPALRRDALVVLLACLPKQQAEATAVGVLSGGAAATAPSTAPATAPAVSTSERKLALKHLARGEEGFQQLRERMYLYRARESSTVISTDGKPQVPAAPQSLKPEMLRDLLAASPSAGVDEETAAYAGYLACLLGRPEGMQPLAKYWREKARDDEQWKAALGDDALTPLLQEVYSAYGKESYSVREFYWTIRSIKGPNILKLRKQIRDEVGMDRLR